MSNYSNYQTTFERHRANLKRLTTLKTLWASYYDIFRTYCELSCEEDATHPEEVSKFTKKLLEFFDWFTSEPRFAEFQVAEFLTPIENLRDLCAKGSLPICRNFTTNYNIRWLDTIIRQTMNEQQFKEDDWCKASTELRNKLFELADDPFQVIGSRNAETNEEFSNALRILAKYSYHLADTFEVKKHK